MVQMRVVQDRESRKAEEIGPDVLVRGGITELEDREIVRFERVEPDEIMRRARARGNWRASAGNGCGVVDEDIDPMLGGKRGNELGAVDSDAGAGGRHRTEPGEARHGFHCSGERRSGRPCNG